MTPSAQSFRKKWVEEEYKRICLRAEISQVKGNIEHLMDLKELKELRKKELNLTSLC